MGFCAEQIEFSGFRIKAANGGLLSIEVIGDRDTTKDTTD